MTPEERAENNISLNRRWNTDEDIRKQIASEICAAVEEATILCSRPCDEIIRQAKAEAYEDAAKYLEHRASIIRGDWNGPDLLNQSAHELRARAAELLTNTKPVGD